MPLILGTNSIKDTAYNVANSCRFETNTYMTKTASSGNRRTLTFSYWVKRAALGAVPSGSNQFPLGTYQDSNNRISTAFTTNNTFVIYAAVSGSTKLYFETNRIFRDISAWMHFVIKIDTTQSTESNRLKLYINGVEETSFSTATYPSQNDDLIIDTNIYVGTYDTSNNFYHGYLAEMVYIDGTALDQTSFGEFDEDSPTIWKPKNVSGLTFGTNGFYLDFEDASNLGNDANGGTDLTEYNLTTTDQSTDTCTNNFATLNPLLDVNNPQILSNGNLTATGSGSGNHRFAGSTMPVASGKWYYEVKVTVSGSNPYVGLIDSQSNLRRNGIYFVNSDGDANNPSGFAVNMSGDIYHNNSNSYASNIGSISTNDILGFAINMDSSPKTCEIYKNGSSQRSFNLDEPPSGFYMLGCNSSYNTSSSVADMNFGSPAFTISSGNSDANDHGNFEYSVPSGYFALCTKNLAEFG